MWYFYDQLNRRQGPINSAQLRALIDHRVITPETLIETEAGQRGSASRILNLHPANLSGAAGPPPFGTSAPNPSGAGITPLGPDTPNPSNAGNASFGPEAFKTSGTSDGIKITSQTKTTKGSRQETIVQVTITDRKSQPLMSPAEASQRLYWFFYVILHLALAAAAYYLIKGSLHRFDQWGLKDILTLSVRLALLLLLRFVFVICLRHGMGFYASLWKWIFSKIKTHGV